MVDPARNVLLDGRRDQLVSLQELNVVFHSLLEARLSCQRGEADGGNIAHSLAERLEIDAVGGDAEVLFDLGVNISVYERDHSAVYRRQRYLRRPVTQTYRYA